MKPRHNYQYGSYSRNRYHDDLAAEKTKPTAKQKKFLACLCTKCKENDLETAVGFRLYSRVDYAAAINTLIARLNEAGVEIQGNGKNFTKSVAIGTDSRGRDFISERMVHEE